MKQLLRVKIYIQLGIIGLLLLSACATTPTPLAIATQKDKAPAEQTAKPKQQGMLPGEEDAWYQVF